MLFPHSSLSLTLTQLWALWVCNKLLFKSIFWEVSVMCLVYLFLSPTKIQKYVTIHFNHQPELKRDFWVLLGNFKWANVKWNWPLIIHGKFSKINRLTTSKIRFKISPFCNLILVIVKSIKENYPINVTTMWDFFVWHDVTLETRNERWEKSLFPAIKNNFREVELHKKMKTKKRPIFFIFFG